VEIQIPAELARRLRRAHRVAVLTGAGVSAESGIPTFRDAQTGLWAQFRPEELATPEAFRRHPCRVWEWYAYRRERATSVQPNAGHRALAELERCIGEFTLITQNVDGLHQRAGSRNVLELHGNILRTKCFEENVVVTEWADSGEVPPRCPRCGGLLRPDVVWFGEALPEAALEKARRAAAESEVFLSIGTSAQVYPAAGLIDEALAGLAYTVEINPDPTPYSHRVVHALSGPAGSILPALLKAAFPP
jgi:NAD-dependent deacetylase